MKKLAFGILTLCLLLCAFALSANAATVVESGTCGANGGNLTWTLDDAGTLTISGTGEMADYFINYDSITQHTYAPWGGSDDNVRRIKQVVIENGVTSIGVYAFCGCDITSVTIPQSVTTIEYGAFHCTSVEDIFYEGSEEQWNHVYIESYNGVVDNYSPYYQVVELHEYYGIADSGICGNDLTWTLYNTGLLTISGTGKMYNYTTLYEYNDYTSAPWVGTYSNSTRVKSVSIAEGVTSIARSAFAGCTDLTSVTIPDSVESIGAEAFSGTAWFNNLPDGLFYAGKVAYIYKGTMPQNTTVVIKDGTKSISAWAFAFCSGLTSVTIPDSVTSIGEVAFIECTGLTTVTIPDSVTSIGGFAFQNCTSLTAVTIGNNVSSIGESAFWGCTGLTSIIIPDSVTTIGNYAFDHSGLKALAIGNGLTSINPAIFLVVEQLETITVGSGNTAYYSINNCVIDKSTGELVLGCKTSVIPDDGSVNSIGFGAFDNSGVLTSVTIPDGVMSIGDYAFNGCGSLTTIAIPDSVTSIGDEAFGYCTNLKDVYYEGSETQRNAITINDNGNDNFTSAMWHYYGVRGEGACGKNVLWRLASDGTLAVSGTGAMDNYASADASPFHGLTIKKVIVEDGVTSVGKYAFYGCAELTEVVFPDSVTKITANAFRECPELTSVTLGTGLTMVEGYAFFHSNKLTDVYYGGSDQQSQSIDIKPGNNPLQMATWRYAVTIETLTEDSVALSWTSAIYNGSPQKPAVTVKNAQAETLTLNTDYTASFSSGCKYPGTYTVTVTGLGNCTGTVEKTFTIKKQPISADRVTLSADSFVYNCKAQQPAVTVKSSKGLTLTKDTSYTVSYASGCKYPGTYQVTVTGRGYYTGAVTKTFTITRQPLDAARVTLVWAAAPYNGQVQQPAVTMKNAAGYGMTQNKSYTVRYSGDSKNPGTYKVTVSGIGYYTGTVEKTYIITGEVEPLDASRVTLSETGFIYNGEMQRPSVTVKNSAGAELTIDTDYTVAFSTGSKYPGTYMVTVSGKGRYTGTAVRAYTIAPQPLDISRVTLSWASLPYNGTIQKPTVTVKNVSGYKMTLNKSYTVRYSADSKAPGVYTVTVTGKGYYTGEATLAYAISRQPLAASRVKLSQDVFTANGTEQRPSVTVRNANGTAMKPEIQYTVRYSADSIDPGVYTVTVTGVGYFTGTVTKAYIIQ